MFTKICQSIACPIILTLFASSLITGCASDIDNSHSGSYGKRFVHFNMTVNSNGEIDKSGNGYYVFLLNSQGESIEVTDLDTFTDFIRYDGINFDWFTRQANLPNPGFTFTLAGSLNGEGSVSSDGKSIDVLVSTSNSLLSQYLAGDKFTCHAVTSDSSQDAYIGRILDTMGDGINYNSLQTVMADKWLGAIEPFPSYYPNDLLNDWVTRNDLPTDYPYVNFDINSFTVSIVTAQ